MENIKLSDLVLRAKAGEIMSPITVTDESFTKLDIARALSNSRATKFENMKNFEVKGLVFKCQIKRVKIQDENGYEADGKAPCLAVTFLGYTGTGKEKKAIGYGTNSGIVLDTLIMAFDDIGSFPFNEGIKLSGIKETNAGKVNSYLIID